MDLIVTESEKGNRLDHFLVSHLPGVSRSAIQKLIKSGSVTVNEKKVSVHHFLRVRDRVVVVWDGPPHPNHLPRGEDTGVKVLFEDDDILVVDKPSGLIVHGGPGITGPTLADKLIALRSSLASVGDDTNRPGIVHRLDAEVSGAIIVAKTKRAFEALKQQFKDRTVKKIYTALVVGRIPKDEGTIDFVIGRSRRSGRMAARPKGSEGKEARTHYEVVQRFSNATLLRVRIETGRTHQIRTHFHALGYPLVGDRRYAIKGKEMSHPPPRLFLHATEITFRDILGKEQTVTSPLPVGLSEYLATLTRSHAS